MDANSIRCIKRCSQQAWDNTARRAPPGYRMKEARSKPKICPYLERIAQIIDEDKGYPKKQLQRLYLLVLDELRYVPFSQAGSKTKISLKIKQGSSWQAIVRSFIHGPGVTLFDRHMPQFFSTLSVSYLWPLGCLSWWSQLGRSIRFVTPNDGFQGR